MTWKETVGACFKTSSIIFLERVRKFPVQSEHLRFQNRVSNSERSECCDHSKCHLIRIVVQNDTFRSENVLKDSMPQNVLRVNLCY
jgi:hypothetical protein